MAILTEYLAERCGRVELAELLGYIWGWDEETARAAIYTGGDPRVLTVCRMALECRGGMMWGEGRVATERRILVTDFVALRDAATELRAKFLRAEETPWW